MFRQVAAAALIASSSFAQFATLRGRVIDAQGEATPARVAVAEVGRATILFPNPAEMLVITPGESGEVRKRNSRIVEADRDGRFEINELQPGRYALVAAHTERGIVLRDIQVVAGAADELALTLDPPRFVDLKVQGLTFDPTKHVLELKPATPLGNVNVVPRLKQDGWSFHAGPLPAIDDWLVAGSELVLDHDYRATLFHWQIQTLGAREPIQPLGAGGDDPKRPLTIDLSPGGEYPTVSGRVLSPSGEPLSCVSVVARSRVPTPWRQGAITDTAGHFSLGAMQPESYVLEARRWVVRDAAGCGNGRADVIAERAFDVNLGDTDVRVDLTVKHFEQPLAVETIAPDFTAATLTGEQLKLSDLRGKVVLVDFWATWCAMCRAELPALEKFYAERSKDGRFEIVAVSIDDEAELVRRFLASRKLPWKQIALGPVDVNPITRLYNVWGTPNTVVIDRDGKIAARNLLGAELRAKIDELLRKQ